jgi:hypothetical protein
MTEIVTAVRHYCRNPRCRSKLPAPVANERDAFCARGCHSSFYRKRCLVCEAPMERRTERQLVCGKRRCRNALKAGQSLGRYHTSSAGVSPLENPTKSGIPSGIATDRPWHVVAGLPLTPSQLHCATLGADAIVRPSRVLIKRGDPPVNVVGGYKFPYAPIIAMRPP